MKIFVTGANGFIGSVLCPGLLQAGNEVHAAVRSIVSLTERNKSDLNGCLLVETGDIGASNIDWHRLLCGVDVVIHLAGWTRELKGAKPISLEEYRKVNVRGTATLAEASLRANVKRLIFVSSIGVNGNQTISSPFTEEDDPNPYYDHYALSKWESEDVLNKLFGLDIKKLTIIRPALVYGPHVKGNMLRLLDLVRMGLPLPFARIRNSRSLISVMNLSDLVIRCVEHPNAAGQIFLASDGEDISTPELIHKIADALGKSARLFGFPMNVLSFGAVMLGKKDIIDRLCGSLVVDSNKVKRVLGWFPRFTLDCEIKNMVAWYISEYCRKE